MNPRTSPRAAARRVKSGPEQCPYLLLPGRVPAEILDRWHYRAEESLAFTRADRSAIYGGVHLYVLG